MLVFSVNSRILVFWCRAGVGRWSAERRRSARGIWLEATHAINAHRGDCSGGNVARPSRQPSHSNAVVRGHQYGPFLSLQLQSANLRNVRAGSDRWQPRILQSEPVLPRARIRSAQDQAEAILLLIHASPALGVGGRIFKANAAPVGSPWMWTLAFGHHEDRTPRHGYAESREAAMTTFAKSWRRE